MDLDIRKNVISNIKGDTDSSIIDLINESVGIEDELALPGLGVLLELFWNDLDKKEQKNIASIIKSNINKNEE